MIKVITIIIIGWLLISRLRRTSKEGTDTIKCHATSKVPNCGGCKHSSIVSTTKGIQVHCGIRCRTVRLFDDCPIDNYRV